jgi:hypothetical protein
MTATIGVDLAQRRDHSAVVLVESYRPEPETPTDWPPVRHDVRWATKFPLGMGFTEQVAAIKTIAEACGPLGHTIMVVDSTGLGAVVVEMLRSITAVSMRTVVFTGGESATKVSAFEHHVPKRDLLAAVGIVLEQERLGVPMSCPFRTDLLDEMLSIERSISERGHDSYAAAGQGHDDLTMALCLAVWWADRPDQGAVWHQAALLRAARSPAAQRAAEQAARDRLADYQARARAR